MFYLTVFALLAYSIVQLCYQIPYGFILLIFLASFYPAQRSLYQHVAAVADALEKNDIMKARHEVSMIVGRKTTNLNEAEISRAAIESLSENFSDGIVAPLFWLFTGGFIGATLYKATNTADSVIGHKNERYSAFGWAAARFDDLLNLPCSRLSALWILVAAFFVKNASPKNTLKTIFKDARRHRSPNAGWPEAAMAGALDFKLGGSRIYENEIITDSYMGSGRSELTSHDIRNSLKVYNIACMVQLSLFLSILLIQWFFKKSFPLNLSMLFS